MEFFNRIKELKRNDTTTFNSAEKSQNIRLSIIQIVFIILFLILLQQFWSLQIINGQTYAEDYELKTTKMVRNNNTRGIIYDCNGKVLAYNELVYTMTMMDDGEYPSERERQLTLNSMIYYVAKKLEQNKEQINNELKIRIGPDGNYEYTVTGKALMRFKADVFGEVNPDDMTPEQRQMEPGKMIQFLAENNQFAIYGHGKNIYSEEELLEYRLPKEYSKEEVLTLVGIRYMLSLNSYKKYVPIILARDVSEKTVAFLFENSQSLTGIDIGEDWNRVYVGGEAFSHILGYTGKISSEEMEQYAHSDSNYHSESIVGKAGIEQYLETQLQGSDGEGQITVNNVGKIISQEKVIKETVSGKDVYLSIDKELQAAIYNILEQNLAGIISSNLINTKEFEKTNISDTSDIRIPIYDVFIALVNNSIFSLEDLYGTDATKLEQEMAGKLEVKEAEVKEKVAKELLKGETVYEKLSKETQEYMSYAINELGILNKESIQEEDDIYKKWKNKKGISVKEFLFYAIQKGWITGGIIDSKQKYLSADEMYPLLIESIVNKIANNSEFEKILFKWLILEEQITGMDICMLLYDQQVLANRDDDYEKLLSGKMEAFQFIKKKIEHLEITPAQLALDPCSASAVVVQPESGKVLALVSYPGYDNNRLANQMDVDYYNQLLNDKSLPLYNRATQQLTAPGSTFKPITIIAGLQEEIITPDTSEFCDGVFDKVVPSLKCWKHSGHGNVINAPTALQFSCNDYLCQIAYKMGTQNSKEYKDKTSLNCLQEYSQKFLLHKKSGIEITESEPHISDAYGIPSAIGQGTHNFATVQLARYVSAITTEGDVFSLSLIKGIRDTNGVFTKKESILEEKAEMSDDVWNTVHSGMVQFAKNNAVLKNIEISIAGKTGTAQESKSKPDHALFIGYAPADSPKMALAVRIANGYGSSNATIVGKNILNYYFGLESPENIITGEATQAFNTSAD